MRLIEGTVEEIVEYQARMGKHAQDVGGTDGGILATDPTDEVDSGRSIHPDGWNPEDEFFIRQFVYARAVAAETARRVLEYIDRVAKLGIVVSAGVSERTRDGLSDYLMVRDDGPRKFGAVAYIRPRNGGLSLRLRREHVAGIKDSRIQLREVASSSKYAVNCPLHDDEAVELAIDLTKRALQLVRTGDGTDNGAETHLAD